ATLCNNGILRLWDVAFATEIKRSIRLPFSGSIALDPSGSYLAVSVMNANMVGGKVLVYNLLDSPATGVMKPDSFFSTLAFSRDGRLCATIDPGGVFAVREVATGNVLSEMRMSNSPGAVAFSLSGSRLAIADTSGRTILCGITNDQPGDSIQL